MEHVAAFPSVTQHAIKKLLSFVEIALVFALIMIQIWFWQNRSAEGTACAYALITGIVLAGWKMRGSTFAMLGLRDVRFVIPAGMLCSGKLAVQHFHLFSRCSADIAMTMGVVGYFAWALVQELILNGFFAVRLHECITHRGASCVVAGIIFAACHIPNRVLMPVTLLWGVASSYVFLRMKRRNIYMLALIHAVVGYGIALLLPHIVSWRHPMAVGPLFFQ